MGKFRVYQKGPVRSNGAQEVQVVTDTTTCQMPLQNSKFLRYGENYYSVYLSWNNALASTSDKRNIVSNLKHKLQELCQQNPGITYKIQGTEIVQVDNTRYRQQY